MTGLDPVAVAVATAGVGGGAAAGPASDVADASATACIASAEKSKCLMGKGAFTALTYELSLPARETVDMIQDVQKELAVALGKSHEALKRELTKLRAGRASANLLDGIKVDYYGTPTPLTQMAHVNTPEPRLITVKPWDKTQIKAVEKALRESDLGLNPQVESDVVRIPLPPLTEERRKEFVKIAKKYGEDCKVAIRKARHDAIDMLSALENEGEASADDVDRGKKKVEESVADAIKVVDGMISSKEKDILEV
jgi:ribosome recycling factor